MVSGHWITKRVILSDRTKTADANKWAMNGVCFAKRQDPVKSLLPLAKLPRFDSHQSTFSPSYSMQNDKASTSDTGKLTNNPENHASDVSEILTTSRARAATNIASSLGFIETVKTRSAKDNKPEVYDGFIQLMQEFHLHHIDLAGLTDRTTQLFKDYPDLNNQFDEEFIQPSKAYDLENSNKDINSAEDGSQAQT